MYYIHHPAFPYDHIKKNKKANENSQAHCNTLYHFWMQHLAQAYYPDK